MSAIRSLSRPPAPDWLRQRIYAGDLLLVHGGPAVRAMIEYFGQVLRDAFAPHSPPQAQFAMDRAEWDELAKRLRATYKRDPQAWSLMRELLEQFGLEAARTAADCVNLRVQPHAEEPTTDPQHTLGAHRDTWASNVYTQINWWLPVFPITPRRTICFLPYFWDQAVDNDSASWDLEAVRAEVRAARAAGREPAVRNTPEPVTPIDPNHAVAITVEPGDVLIFSGAHLHASVPNDSGATRFSLELRSLDISDTAADLGAPNVDGYAPHRAWHWFRRLDSGARLSAADCTQMLPDTDDVGVQTL